MCACVRRRPVRVDAELVDAAGVLIIKLSFKVVNTLLLFILVYYP